MHPIPVPPRIGGIALILVGLLSSSVPLAAQTASWDDRFGFPGTDGPVLAVAYYQGDLYIGGRFTEVGGTPLPGLARWDGRKWAAVGGGLTAGGTVIPTVDALAVSGDSLVVGGFFTHAGGEEIHNLAAWDGGAWREIGEGTGDEVYAVASAGGALYVGGRFRSVGNGIPVMRVARWDGGEWSALGSGFGDPGDNFSVYALAAVGDTLYAGGDFTTSGGAPLRRLARWDGAGWTEVGGGVDASVRALALFQGDLYAGGFFIETGGENQFYLARYRDGARVGIDPGPDRPVHCLLAAGDRLYVGGDFYNLPAPGSAYFAAWNGSGWESLGDGVSGSVYAAASDGEGRVAVGGEITQAGSRFVHGVAEWSGLEWGALGLGVAGTVRAVAAGPGGVYIGGDFNLVAGIAARRVAFWDGASWHAMGEGLGGTVFALAVSDGVVYAGGEFEFSGSTQVRNVARWDGAEWVPLGGGLDGACRALLPGSDGLLYAGGSFNQAGQAAASKIASWDGNSWSGLGSAVSTPFYVDAVVEFKGDLVVGGRFDGIGGVSARNVASWDGSTWRPLSDGLDADVTGLLPLGDELYAVGKFTGAGSFGSSGIARWNGDSWSGLVTAGADVLPVEAIAAYGDSLVIGGSFTRVGERAANGLALWDGSEWRSFGSGVGGTVLALAGADRDLYVGGDFHEVDGVSSSRFGRWTGDGMVPVRLLSFTARREGGAVALDWEIEAAWGGHAGFHVYRQDGEGERARLTPALLSGLRSYHYVDLRPSDRRARYWLAELDRAGGVSWFGPREVAGIAPTPAELARSRPNPFRETTVIPLRTGASEPVTLRILDVRGRVVRTLLDGVSSPGEVRITWDGRDDEGRQVPAGIYFYRLATPRGTAARRLVRLR